MSKLSGLVTILSILLVAWCIVEWVVGGGPGWYPAIVGWALSTVAWSFLWRDDIRSERNAHK